MLNKILLFTILLSTTSYSFADDFNAKIVLNPEGVTIHSNRTELILQSGSKRISVNLCSRSTGGYDTVRNIANIGKEIIQDGVRKKLDGENVVLVFDPLNTVNDTACFSEAHAIKAAKKLFKVEYVD